MSRSWQWTVLRNHWIKNNDFCVRCGYKKDPNYWDIHGGSDLIVDHIQPIKLGGKEFDEENIQTLCKWCNHEKNKIDQSMIAKAKRIARYG